MQRVYELNAPGWNHGLLLGTKRWVPSAMPCVRQAPLVK
jgi:hypothetical protein